VKINVNFYDNSILIIIINYNNYYTYYKLYILYYYKLLYLIVCRAAMNELENEVLKANPNKLVDVGNFRMDADGNTIHKKVKR